MTSLCVIYIQAQQWKLLLSNKKTGRWSQVCFPSDPVLFCVSGGVIPECFTSQAPCELVSGWIYLVKGTVRRGAEERVRNQGVSPTVTQTTLLVALTSTPIWQFQL